MEMIRRVIPDAPDALDGEFFKVVFDVAAGDRREAVWFLPFGADFGEDFGRSESDGDREIEFSLNRIFYVARNLHVAHVMRPAHTGNIGKGFVNAVLSTMSV